MAKDGTIKDDSIKNMEEEEYLKQLLSIRPKLPLELLEQIISEFALPCTYGDPVASTTLAACSLVNNTFRHWALRARFSVIVTPRHVRDFRRWYSRSQNDMQGYNRALFIALDDVSKLTSMSAGWDVEMLKLLQQQGPNLQQLSLWSSETKALLRDPAQIRGARIRASSTSLNNINLAIKEVMQSNGKRRKNVIRLMKQIQKGKFIQGEALSAIPLKSDFTNRDEAQTRAERAAAKERARQTLPNWLKHELDSKEAAKEIKRRYKAHISADAREYQHEREAAQEARKTLAENELKALETLTQHTQSFNLEDSEDESDDDNQGDVEFDWACMPLKLSICPSLPLHEHEEPLNFARMTIWTRVEELDIFVSVPSEVPRCLELFASLIASPLTKFRFSSIYASILITLTSTGIRIKNKDLQQPEVNIAYGLQRMLESHVLRSLLFHEFNNHRVPDVAMLERAICTLIASSRCTDVMKQSDNDHDNSNTVEDSINIGKKKHERSSLASSLVFDRISDESKDNSAEALVKVKILQGNQAHFGKLKDRRQDFLNRALRFGPDCWSVNCV